MKKVMLVIGVLWAVTLHAQKVAKNDSAKPKGDSSLFITINPFGYDKALKYVRYGDRVKFKISNVNTFNVKATLKRVLWNYETEIPEAFREILNPEKSKGQTNDSLTQEKGLPSLKSSNAPNIDSLKDLNIERFKYNFYKFIETYQQITLMANLHSRLTAQLSDSLFIRDTAVLKAKCKSLYEISYREATDLLDAKTVIFNSLVNLQAYFSGLKLYYEALQDNMDPETGQLSGKLENKDKSGTVTITNAVFTINKKKYFESEFAFAKKIYDEISDLKIQKELTDKAYSGIDLYNEIIHCDFTYYTPSVAITSDEVTLTPTLLTVNSKTAYEFNPFTIRTKGGFKVNFSSGYLLSFTGDDNYTSFRDTAGKVIGIAPGNTSSITHAIGAMAHAYWRFPCDLNVALSTGLSISATGNLNFYMGLSAMFLEKNRLLLSFGVSYVQKQVLNTANLKTPEGNRYAFLSASDNEIRYDKVYKRALFIGVTYNLWNNSNK